MYRTWLIPYLEGALDAEQRRQFEARLAEDPELRAELAALRRTQPRLRQAALYLRQTDPATVPAGSVWPRLRGRLDAQPTRPLQSGPGRWWLGGGLCAAGVVLLAVVVGPKMHPVPEGVQVARVNKSTPVIVFHRDNAVGTTVAAGLRKRAARVAEERRAVQTRVVALPHPAKPTLVRPAPAAPPLPGNPSASDLPMPVAPPVRMARREPDRRLFSDSGLPPAPTHSPGLLRDASPLSIRAAGKANGGEDVRAMVGDSASSSKAAGQAPLSRRFTAVNPAEAHNGGLASAPSPLFSPRGNSPRGNAGGGFGGGGQENVPDTALSPPPHAFAGAPADGGDAIPSSLRLRLERTVTQPLYGTTAGVQEQQRLLQEAQQAGTLDALASQLEQAPISVGRAAQQELLLGRMRAAVYETAGDLDRALSERRAVALLSTADGEDWFQLAQMEARLGNTASAQRAYAQALRASGSPLSAAHRATAHRNLP